MPVLLPPTRLAPLLLTLLVGATAWTSWGSPEARADAAEAPDPGARIEALLARAGSPVVRVRAQAGADLDRLLQEDPAVAGELLQAWAAMGVPARGVVVLAAVRGGDEALRREVIRRCLALPDAEAHPLLRHLVMDARAGAVLLDLLRKDPGAFADPLAWGVGGDAEAARLAAFVTLVQRAEIESLLVALKSPTGLTGYYKGLYASLAAHPRRDLVLDVLLGIALDIQPGLPRAVGLGTYDLLIADDVEFYELRDMALNALGEIARPTDTAVIDALKSVYVVRRGAMRLRRSALARRARVLSGLGSRRFEEQLDALGATLILVADVLTTLYNIDPGMAPELDAFLEDLEYGWPWEVRPLQREGLRPNILIRVGRYAEAIDEYERELDRIWSTKSFSYYNMACAYASWSRDPGTRSAEFLRERALRCLEQAFASGWRDVGWMETDGDLDPIRDTERYKAVRRAIEIDLDLDADDLAPLPGQAPARRPQR